MQETHSAFYFFFLSFFFYARIISPFYVQGVFDAVHFLDVLKNLLVLEDSVEALAVLLKTDQLKDLPE